MKCRINFTESGEALINKKDLRSMLLELSISCPRYKNLSFRTSVIVFIFVLDSLTRTALESAEEEIDVSTKTMRRCIKTAIKKNKKIANKVEQSELDEELTEISTYDKQIIGELLDSKMDGLKKEIYKLLGKEKPTEETVEEKVEEPKPKKTKK